MMSKLLLTISLRNLNMIKAKTTQNLEIPKWTMRQHKWSFSRF